MSRLDVHVTSTPTADELHLIGSNLAAFNDADAGPADRQVLATLVRVDKELVAGLSGYTAWNWLYIQWLWVADKHRGQGLARELLSAAETEAVRRGCHSAHLDTFNPHALRVYQKAGYTVFGTLADFLPGRTRSFLSKPLT